VQLHWGPYGTSKSIIKFWDVTASPAQNASIFLAFSLQLYRPWPFLGSLLFYTEVNPLLLCWFLIGNELLLSETSDTAPLSGPVKTPSPHLNPSSLNGMPASPPFHYLYSATPLQRAGLLDCLTVEGEGSVLLQNIQKCLLTDTPSPPRKLESLVQKMEKYK
jgi:hypothetical protein